MSFLAGILLVVLLGYDFRHRRLPNRLVAAYAALCPLVLFIGAASFSMWLQHSVVALLAFVTLTLMFMAGGMGGGDVKLGTAVLGWAGTQALVPCLVVIAVAGLVLAVLGVVADALITVQRRSSNSVSRAWLCLLYALSAKRGVPYGVALALGGLVVSFKY